MSEKQKNEKPRRTVRVYTEEAVKNAAKLPADVWREIKHYNKVQMTDYIQRLYRAGFNAGYIQGHEDGVAGKHEHYAALVGQDPAAAEPKEAPAEETPEDE